MKTLMQLILLILINTTLFGQKTSGKITYEIANINFEDKGNNEDITSMLEMAKKQQYQLLFNKDYTSFTMQEVMTNEVYSEFHNVLAKNYVSFTDFYFDYKKNELLEFVKDGTLLEQKIPKLSWQITSESKIIDKYQCYKAIYSFDYHSSRDNKTHTRVITAWFAPSLPYSYGPKNFQGLPGLILELTENTITFLVSKIELSDKKIEIKIPSGRRVPKEEFEKNIIDRKP